MHVTQASMPPKQQHGTGLGPVVQVSHMPGHSAFSNAGQYKTHTAATRACLHLFVILLPPACTYICVVGQDGWHGLVCCLK